jgi:hypothetical protein
VLLARTAPEVFQDRQDVLDVGFALALAAEALKRVPASRGRDLHEPLRLFFVR